MIGHALRLGGVLWLLAAAVADAAPAPQPTRAIGAEEFLGEINGTLAGLLRESTAASWVADTYLTTDSELLVARTQERLLGYLSRVAAESRRYPRTGLDPPVARSFDLLRRSVPAPAPADPAKRAELARLAARLASAYGSGKYCEPAGGTEPACEGVGQLNRIIQTSRDYDELTEAWRRWHTVSAPLRGDYARFVALAAQGARELGYRDLGALWRSAYDMPPEELAAEMERLWQQVRPLYVDLHCYVRDRLGRRYGVEHVPPGRPIPAQLLGNLWAQDWSGIYDLAAPYPDAAGPSVDAALIAQHYDPARMVREAERFYRSLGFPALPATFWDRSLLSRPRDREVVCHASAWTLDLRADVRLKMCIEPTAEDLRTVYHELGHIYYFLSYRDQPLLFRGGAHDGFHEAIGDAITLSMTPGYLQSVGLSGEQAPSPQALINEQLRQALAKVAPLPFGKLIDDWRWRVFAGEVGPGRYNASWWELRARTQGVAAPLPRTEADFDPGAQYHVANSTPFARYFLANILEFQIHKALCDAAGYHGPLHECSIYGSAKAGTRLQAMLVAGASRPWQDTFRILTGSRRMDASALLEYFAPLAEWLRRDNEGRQCGWDG